MAKRIQQARLRSHLSPKELAQGAAISITSIYDYEGGFRTPRSDILQRIAQICETSMEWLQTGNDQIKDVSRFIPDDLPVVGRGGGGRGEFSEDGFPVGEGWKKISRPHDLKDPHAFGVEVRGHSMAPKYEEREFVVCSPIKEWKSGDYCVVKTVEGEYLIKRVKKEDSQLVLTSVAPGHDAIILPLKKVAGVYKIVWKKER